MKKTNIAFAALCAALLATSAGAVPARVKLVRSPDREIVGDLRWNASTREYIFSSKAGSSTVETRYKPADILSKAVEAPANWQALAASARGASPDGAIPGLAKAMDDYKMLEYDCYAANLIATIHKAKNRWDEIVRLGEKITADNPSAPSVSVFAPLYWEALIKTGKNGGGKLNAWIDEAAAKAPHAVAAAALNARGDMLLAENRTKDALKDGFLRTALLYRNARDANAEGLYKAALAFDKLGQASYAEKMRQKLISDHRDSAWTRRAQGAN